MASLGKAKTGEANTPPEKIETHIEEGPIAEAQEPSLPQEEQAPPEKSDLKRKLPLIAALLVGSSALGAYAVFSDEVDEFVKTYLLRKKVGELIYHDLDKYNANLINFYDGQTEVTLEGLSEFTKYIMETAERGHLDNYQVPVLVDEYNQRSFSNGLIRNEEHNANAIIGKTMSQEEINTLSLEEKERIEGKSWNQQFLEHKTRDGVYISAGTEARWANPSSNGVSYQSAPSTSRVLVTGGDIESSVAQTEMVGVSLNDIGNTEDQVFEGDGGEEGVPTPNGEKVDPSALKFGNETASKDSSTSSKANELLSVSKKAIEGTKAGAVVTEMSGEKGIVQNVKDGNFSGVAENVGNIGKKVMGDSMIGIVVEEFMK